MRSEILEALFAISVFSELFGEAPDPGRAQDFRINTVFFEDLAHGLATGELPVSHLFELRSKGDPARDDGCDKWAFAEFSDFFSVEWFFSHKCSFPPLRYEHYYSRIYPVVRLSTERGFANRLQ